MWKDYEAECFIVEVRPQLGRLEHASGIVVHPRGDISVSVRREGDALCGNLLPRGVKGYLVSDVSDVKLKGKLSFRRFDLYL